MKYDHIVIVEDDPAIRESLSDICRDVLNVEACIAPSAAEGLEQLESHRPAVLLLDLTLPDMDGDGVVAEIRKRGWDDEVRIVLLSAQSDVDETAEKLGVFGYLAKPFSLQDVVKVMRDSGAA